MDNKKKYLKNSGVLNPNPEKVKDTNFLNNNFFDPNDIIQVKYEMIRKVEQEKLSISETALNFGFSRISFYKSQKNFIEKGIEGLIPKKKGPKKSYKLSENVMEFIKNEIEKDKSLKARAIKVIIEKKFNIVVHIRSIERALVRAKKKMDNTSE
ncbi:MAG: helix-turn-helix domain-containing protein [Oligoflexia bacterium]|nr:helix-turn-helix domain-containing protein [Oligoflexia bacterium]